MDYSKGYLDDDALQCAKEVMGNDEDDTAQLKKIAQLVEDGSKKIWKKLSKEEFKAGLDALCLILPFSGRGKQMVSEEPKQRHGLQKKEDPI